MGSLMLSTAKELLGLYNAYNKALDKVLPEDLCKIVKFHGLGAAVTSTGAGLLPGVGGVACTAVYAGFVWSMYGRLGKAIGLPFNKHILKSLAAGVATNLAAAAVTTLAVTAVASIIPGMSLVAAAVYASLGYAVVSAAGILYMKLLIKLAKSKKDPVNLSAEELSAAAKEIMKETDVKGILKTMKNEYKEVKDEKISIDESDADEYSEEFTEDEVAEMEQQQKDSEARDIKDELEDKKSMVARAISELKGKTNMLQTEVDKSGSLAREFLHSIAESLESIERNKSVLEDADKTALKRNHKILADTFKRAKNASEFSVNIDIINEIFKTL